MTPSISLLSWMPKLSRQKLRAIFWLAIILSVVISSNIWASSGGEGPGEAVMAFLAIAIILIAAKLSSLVEKIGQPSVLGELVMGVVLGNLTLIGFNGLDWIKDNHIIEFLSELGVVILLFQIGLESNIREMKKVGMRAFFVAIIGVVLPFIIGTYIVGPWLVPGLSQNAYIFLGATLTATSVGITARVFRDLGKLQTAEAKVVLGAAVIDDVLGLIILAVVSAIVTVGAVSLGTITWIAAKAILFLVGAIVLGQLLAPYLCKFFSKIHTGIGMKFTIAIVFALVFAYLAALLGLAPIVGAFAAGLILDAVHFRYFKNPKMVDEMEEVANECQDESIKSRILGAIKPHSEKHIEDIIEPISYFLVPIFFVFTGMAVKLETMFDFKVLAIALGVTVAAFIGKLVSGYAAGKDINRQIVGWGMVPRGEVGLIFAAIGRGLGDDTTFSIIVIMVIVSTLVPPPVLTALLRKQDKTKTQ